MIGTDQDQGMASNASVNSSNERGEDDAKAKGKEDTPPATREKKGKGASAANDESESYIHVRARKGQATNRHSLAERVGTVHTDFNLLLILLQIDLVFLEHTCVVECKQLVT